MLDKPGNPSAFPRPSNGSYGMTLRDYFAGQALASIPTRQWDHVGDGKAMMAAWAQCAYGVADAMLAERAKSEGE
jgi:hypothetical protein